MAEDRHRAKLAVIVLVESDGKLLLLRRANTGWQDGRWDMPSGHVEHQETIVNAAVRELAEETGLVADPASATVAYVGYDSKRGYVDFFVRVKAWNGQPSITEPDKCDGIDWFEASAPPDDFIEVRREGMAAMAAGHTFSELEGSD